MISTGENKKGKRVIEVKTMAAGDIMFDISLILPVTAESDSFKEEQVLTGF